MENKQENKPLKKAKRKAERRRRKPVFYLITPLIFILLFLLAGEVAVRIIGYHPWKKVEKSIQVEPEGHFFIPHEDYGYTMQPGIFKVTQDTQITWAAIHDQSTYRITDFSEMMVSQELRPEIWIFGGSFTYGWCLTDNQTYPWLLQQAIPEYKVRNFGVGGYGTLHSLRQLKHQLRKRKKPEIVVLSYASIHDQRNAADRFWMKAVTQHEFIRDLKYPFARLNHKDSLYYGMMPLNYQPWPGMEFSAFVHFLEINAAHFQSQKLRIREVTRRLIGQIISLCRYYDIEFVLAGIYPDAHTAEMLKHFSDLGYHTVDISVNMNNPELTFLPLDPHPNAAANEIFAHELEFYLKEMLMRDNQVK